MSGQENTSSKGVQGIAASPPLPLVPRRNKTPKRGEEKEDGDNITCLQSTIRTTAEDSHRRKCGFNSHVGKRQPCNNQGAAASAETDARAAQRHSRKVEDHKGRDSGFADRSQLECTWGSLQTSNRQPIPRRPADEEGDRSSQRSRPSLTWDNSDLTGDPQEKILPHSPRVSKENELFADQDLFSPVQNAEFQPEDERDKDELYTPRRFSNERTTEYHPATGDTDLNYSQLSSESDKESDDAEDTVGLLISFNYTTPIIRTTTVNRTLTQTQS
ncbi:hypothetical protein OUZ56_026090 [Daphnia magna]|uniref:Uncharacterized protein n=1 Tax=Daphnia magna TaxID=35525 RepID=A0ABQ9ZKV4_9CRUS|nr:hypothetical protein OUZ56_026090 [Daphnia magna]